MKPIRLSLRQMGFVVLLILAASLPFEMERPLLAVGPLVVTNVELLLGLVLLLAAVALPQPAGMGAPRSWLVLGALFVLGLIMSTTFAPEYRGNAAKASLRTLSGLLLALAVLRLAVTPRQRKAVALALLAGGLLAAAIGLTETISGYDFAWLRIFRQNPTVAGPFLRLAGPFDYANQTAMYIEGTFAILIAALATALAWQRKWPAALLLLGLVLYIQAAVLTFSRSSFVTIAVVGVVVTGLLFFRSSRDPARRRLALLWGGSTLLVALVIAGNWLLSDAFRLRLQSDVDMEWYRAEIVVPESLELRADATVNVPVTLTNVGKLTWVRQGTNPFTLGMRWQPVGTGRELANRPHISLPADVKPGETLTFSVPVRAPIEGGEYRLVWDVIHENVTWFGSKSQDREIFTQVAVSGSVAQRAGDAQLTSETTPPLAFERPIPGRRQLWTAAFQLIAAHPLTGLGLDNYRLMYRPVLNELEGTDMNWNDTIHTNNWYLETLVSFGIAGGLPFLLWLAWLALDILRTGLRPSVSAWQMAAGAGLLAFMVHGLLDYFLLFNATALLFWILAGLWIGLQYDNARI